MARTGYISELLRALAVLVFVLFNFAHAPVAAAGGGGWADRGVIGLCGDTPYGHDNTHGACHACRIGGGADLPPPPDCPLRVSGAATVRYQPRESATSTPPAYGWPAARGPPFFV